MSLLFRLAVRFAVLAAAAVSMISGGIISGGGILQGLGLHANDSAAKMPREPLPQQELFLKYLENSASWAGSAISVGSIYLFPRGCSRCQTEATAPTAS